MNHSILIVGGGNMGGAIAHALHASHAYHVHVVEPDATKRNAFASTGMGVYASLSEAAPCDSLLLAIKPQQFSTLRPELMTYASARSPLVLSIMAGIALADLQKISPRAVRAMPNLPAIIHESMSVLCAPTLDASSREIASSVFTGIGDVTWVEDEELLHAVTAISGSGPAYLFAFMEMLEEAALALGLNAALAKTLIGQTIFGSAGLAHQSPLEPAALRMQVTSKGGTTEAALAQLMTPPFREAILHAVTAAKERSRALAARG